MLTQKVYLLPENLAQLNDSNLDCFGANNSGFHMYLFQLIILLKLASNNLALSWVGKVTTGT